MLPLGVEPPTDKLASDVARRRPDPDLFVHRLSPLLDPSWAAGPPEWWQWSLAWIAGRQTGRLRRSRRRPTRSLRSLTSTAPTDNGDPPPTARYCCSAAALARPPAGRSAARRSWAPDQGFWRVAPATSPYAPSSLRGRARSRFQYWRVGQRAWTAFCERHASPQDRRPSDRSKAHPASPQGPTAL